MSDLFKDDVQKMKNDLTDIRHSLKIVTVPKDFQVEFFCRAVKGINGFLLVCMMHDTLCSMDHVFDLLGSLW